MKHTRILASLAAIAAAGFVLTIMAPASNAAEALLSGTIKSSSGENMGGVTVSAKAEGSTITTTVFTDEAGNYYFPPLSTGQYRVWAQALSYETAKGELYMVRLEDVFAGAVEAADDSSRKAGFV